MKRFIFVAALMATQPLFADSNLPSAYWANRELPDAKQEAQAEQLMEQIRCLVCQGQSIADSDAEIAGDMRDLVRRRIASGFSPASIRVRIIDRMSPASSASESAIDWPWQTRQRIVSISARACRSWRGSGSWTLA